MGKDSVCNETDEEDIKISGDDEDEDTQTDITDTDFDDDKNMDLFQRQHSEFTQRDETMGDETFSLVNEWSKADPPIVFLNASHIVSITKPNLMNDLQFQREFGEQTYTLLCSDLDECKHQDSEEWKLVQK